MTQSRESQIDLASTPYYHVYNRCVRQAYLFNSRKGIDHKQCFVDRMKYLASVFCIDVAAYAVMSNHYHIVVHIDAEKAASLSEREVAQRWVALFKNQAALSWLEGASLSDIEQAQLNNGLPLWRERLSDLSWFMRCLNEYLAREINQAEDKKGRFWEGRFKSQALLDKAALLTCMQYVDLNPIRSAMPVNTLESSDYTSIQDHLVAYQKRHKTKAIKALSDRESKVKLRPDYYPAGLMRFSPENHNVTNKSNHQHVLPVSLTDYITLVEWTGKTLHRSKKGIIPEDIESILTRFSIQPSAWTKTIKHYSQVFYKVVGHKDNIHHYREALNDQASIKKKTLAFPRQWMKGSAAAASLFK